MARSQLRKYIALPFVIVALFCWPLIMAAIAPFFGASPRPGNHGYTDISRVCTPSMYMFWTPATDDHTARESLEYRVFGSFQDDIESVQAIHENGVPLCDWMPNLVRFTVGDSPYFYFNVMVRNPYGKDAAYNTFRLYGQFDDLAETLQWMAGNISDRCELVTVDLEAENDTQIALTGLALMQTNETYSAEALQRLGARYLLLQFGYLVDGMCGDEFKGCCLINATNECTAELEIMGLEHENWYGEGDQVTTIFDPAEFFNATCDPEPKWFDNQLARLSFNGVPTDTYLAASMLEYWYAREISGDGGVYTPRIAADGSTWSSHIPAGGSYAFTNFTEVFRSTKGLLKIYEIV